MSDLPASPADTLPLTNITPHRGWFDWRLAQLWRYRDLISRFVLRDCSALIGAHHRVMIFTRVERTFMDTV
jgi:hypothetical protein